MMIQSFDKIAALHIVVFCLSLVFQGMQLPNKSDMITLAVSSSEIKLGEIYYLNNLE